MKSNLFSLIVYRGILLSTFLALISCQVPSESTSSAIQLPIPVDTAKGLDFDCLIYENDFNQLPADGDVDAYLQSNKDALPGFVFRIDNIRQFSPGLQAFVKTPSNQQCFRISMDLYKAADDILGYENTKGTVVVSWHRQDSTISYQQYPVVDWLKQYHRHLVNHWENIVIWSDVPDSIIAGDQLKVYLYNPYGGPLLMDNLKIERWIRKEAQQTLSSEFKTLLQRDFVKASADREWLQDSSYQNLKSAVVVNQPKAYSFLTIYTQLLSDSTIQGGHEIKVSLVANRAEKIRFYGQSTQLVVSVERNNKAVYWKGQPVEAKMVREGHQVVDAWIDVKGSFVLPDSLQRGDVLKVYLWNQQLRPLFVKRAVLSVR